MAKDFAAYGAEPEQIEAALAGAHQEEAGELEIYPCNWDAVQVFLSLTPRWQIDGLSGRYQGIPRPDIESSLRLMQFECGRHRELFEDFRVMERAALEILNRVE